MTETSSQPTWTFDLHIYGAIHVPARFQLEEVEVFFGEHPVFQDIEIRSASYGAQVVMRLMAENAVLAGQLGLFYLEQLLDVLATRCNCALSASRQEGRSSLRDRGMTKRTVEKVEWQSAFRELFHLRQQAPRFLGALRRYRLALGAEGARERFVGFFQAIREIAPLPARDFSSLEQEHLEAFHLGFRELWGEVSVWPFFLQEPGALQEVCSLVARCEQMVAPVMPDDIEQMVDRLELVHRASHAYLVEWRNQRLELPGDFYAMSIYPETGWGHLLH